MDMEPGRAAAFTQPDFLDRSQKLVSRLRKYSTAELMEFMQISEKLATLNRQRFKDWQPPFSTDNARQALLAFTGDVYEGIDAPTLTKGDLSFAQDHLRILSGLYGLLRPLDLIQPYRLEMGRPLETRGAKTLYAFWKASITNALNDTGGGLLINLASQEYFKAIDKRNLDMPVVTPVFKDEKNGRLKVISFFAKKARGSMARYIIQNRITEADGLLAFAADGYSYNPGLSKPAEPVFSRPEK
jgi:cytoplasmic iron level regulating protein YaaA (DUF328/UPF0246 family)